MPIDALPSISRSDTDFRTKVDDYFLTKLPTFSTQAEEARLQIVAAESTTKSAASTASTDANTATTAANTATSARDSAVAAKNSAETAAAQAVSGNVATPIHEAVSKTTPVDADELGLSDSAASWGLKKLTFANLKAWIGSLFVSKSGDTINGNLNFGGTGRWITGDFSNATPSNRLSFSSSTTNGNTTIQAIPNGTAQISGFAAFNASAIENSASWQAFVTASDARLVSGAIGTGTYLSMTFYTGGSERLRIDTSGNVLVTGSGGLGYGTGSGGTVTQNTSKSTTVPLNKPSGRVTMNAAALSAGGTVYFTLSNASIGETDGLLLTLQSGFATTGTYEIKVDAIVAGSAVIGLKNISAGSLSEAVTFNFQVIKGATS